MTATICVLLGLWLLVSALNQIGGRWSRVLRPLNDFCLLPRMHFFAPEPSDVDYHLAFRDIAPNGHLGPWHSAPVPSKSPLGLLWFPEKRDHESLMSAVGGIASLQPVLADLDRDTDALVQLSFPYLFLLNRAQQAAPLAADVRRQFMVVETSGFGPSRTVALGILSNPHKSV